MLDAAFEALSLQLTDADGGADLDRARATFWARTGEFALEDPFYEARTRALFDFWLCDWRSADGSRPAARNRDPELAAVAAACPHAERGLFRVVEEAPLRVEELLFGAAFRLPAVEASGRLRAGDVFDGRLLVVSDEIQVTPGLLFHPPETHEALDALLPDARELGLERADILDGLLRMRMRLHRFTSIRPRHIYRLDALLEADINSAGWARKQQSSQPSDS
ncbi:MAG: hypothetical protein RLP09_35945 [Sandaracinaceae bacterium]